MRIKIASMLLGASAALPGARAAVPEPARVSGVQLSALTLADQHFLQSASGASC